MIFFFRSSFALFSDVTLHITALAHVCATASCTCSVVALVGAAAAVVAVARAAVAAAADVAVLAAPLVSGASNL